MTATIARRAFIAALGGAAAWPLAAAQGQSLPVVGFLGGRASEPWLASFRNGLGESGYVENQNVTVEYHWLDGEYDRLTPVALPPGRARLATRPSLTGSSPTPKTIGIVAVAALAAIEPGALTGVAITAT
jgi:putative ABC transport system substrate-binding protein